MRKRHKRWAESRQGGEALALMRALAAAAKTSGRSPAHAPFPPVLLRLFEQEGGHICESAPSWISYCTEAIVTTLRLCTFAFVHLCNWKEPAFFFSSHPPLPRHARPRWGSRAAELWQAAPTSPETFESRSASGKEGKRNAAAGEAADEKGARRGRKYLNR